MTVLAPPEPYVDKRTLASYLGMSVRWLEYAMANGLPFYRFGNRVRFRVSEAEAWLDDSQARQEVGG